METEVASLEGEIVRIIPNFPGGLCTVQGKLHRVAGRHADPLYRVRVVSQGADAAYIMFSVSQVKRVAGHDIYLKWLDPKEWEKTAREDTPKPEKYDVYLLSTYAAWTGVEASSEEDAIEKCNPVVWPDQADGPIQFLALKVDSVQHACPYCGEDQLDELVWLNDGAVECQSCGRLYRP